MYFGHQVFIKEKTRKHIQAIKPTGKINIRVENPCALPLNQSVIIMRETFERFEDILVAVLRG